MTVTTAAATTVAVLLNATGSDFAGLPPLAQTVVAMVAVLGGAKLLNFRAARRQASADADVSEGTVAEQVQRIYGRYMIDDERKHAEQREEIANERSRAALAEADAAQSRAALAQVQAELALMHARMQEAISVEIKDRHDKVNALMGQLGATKQQVVQMRGELDALHAQAGHIERRQQ